MADALGRLTAALADRYRLDRELGASGMATVYLAHDLKHEREVAIKVLHEDLGATLGPERFLAEVRTTARLQHPNILTLIDSGAAEGVLYYVMPYVTGESLRARLDRAGGLPLEEALAIVRGAAAALDFAHRQGVVHRDIKPENILLHEGVPMLADFGIALAVASAGGARLTETGISLGTPAYMSPEQVMGERTLDGRCDQYSLACVLYEMLSGAPPFTAPTAQGMYVKHVTERAPELRARRGGLPEGIVRAVARALVKDPAERFATLGDFAAALSAPAATGVTAPDQSIVVLPFENLSPDPDNAFFADGLTEELIADLSKVRALRVISRTSAMHFRGTSKGVPAIARELNVRYVLEGSVRRAGNSLRVTAQLIDAGTDTHLWAEKYGGTLEDVFDLQEKLSRRIVEGLKLSLAPEEDRHLAKRPIGDVRAYDVYLRALAAIGRGTESGMREAIRDLELARGVIGDQALLCCGISYAHWFLANIGIAIEENLDRCDDWARKALALDPHSARARALIGMAGLNYRGSRPSAEVIGHFKEALREDPNEPLALLATAIVHVFAGRVQEASVLSRRYIERDPLDIWAFALPIYLAWFAGEFDRGLEAAQRASSANAPGGSFHMVWALAWAGRREEALAAAEQAAAVAPKHVHAKLALMAAHGLRRDVAAARAELTPEFREWCHRETTWSYFIAAAFALAGGEDDALTWLEHAVDLGWINYPFMAQQDPFLAGLRGGVRFERLMARVKKEWQEFEA